MGRSAEGRPGSQSAASLSRCDYGVQIVFTKFPRTDALPKGWPKRRVLEARHARARGDVSSDRSIVAERGAILQ
eukprot:3606826-Amphidinium_carterae.1